MRWFLCFALILIAILAGNAENSLFAENTADTYTLAYCSNVNGKYQISTINDDGSGQVQITESTQGKEENMNPIWSPTEKKFVFKKSLLRGKNELWLADLKQGTQVKINDNLVKAPVLWSPDGTKVLFVTGEKKKWAMAIYHIGTGDTAILTGNDVDLVEDSNYSWAPDSQWIVAVFRYNRKKDIYKLNVETNQMQKLTQESGDYIHPTWSPDGKYIAFVWDKFMGQKGVYLMNSDGSNQTYIGGNERTKLIRWAPDSSAFEFSYYSLKIEDKPRNRYLHGTVIYDVIEEKKAYESWFLYEFGQYIDPIWAPDSKKLALVINNKLLIIGRDVKKIRGVNIPNAFGVPSWSPDSLKIACAGWEKYFGGTSIYIFSIKDNIVTQITKDARDSFPVWANVKN